MLQFLQKRWFLICLTLLIAAGIALGGWYPLQVKPSAEAVNPLVTTALILFLMSFSLETRQLRAALRAPLPVGLGMILSIGLAPLLGLALMPVQGLVDFRYGLLVATAVPCTMAAASVWTRKAHGNDAISLLVTLTTNLASVATIPFWLSIATWAFPFAVSAADAGTISLQTGGLLDLRRTVLELVGGVLVPIFLGQGCQQIKRFSTWGRLYKSQIGVASQVLILIMVWTASAKGGIRLSQTHVTISLASILLVWGSVIVVHLATLYAGLYSARGLGITRADQIAVAFAGSQKTLPVGLLVSEALSRQAGLSFAVFPMLMYHASQLFLDTLIVEQFLSEESPSSSTPEVARLAP